MKFRAIKQIIFCFSFLSAFYIIPAQTLAAINPSEALVEIDVENESFIAIRVGGDVSVDMLRQFKDLLQKLNQPKHIILNLNSNGGADTSGRAIIKVINEYKAKGVRFSTTVENGSFCLSMCIPIYMIGEQRYAGERSLFMFHGASPWYTNIPNKKSTEEYLNLLIDLGVSASWLNDLIQLDVFSKPSEYWISGEELLAENSNIVTKTFSRLVKIPVWVSAPSAGIGPQ